MFVVGDYLFDSTLNGVLDSADYVADWLAAEATGSRDDFATQARISSYRALEAVSPGDHTLLASPEEITALLNDGPFEGLSSAAPADAESSGPPDEQEADEVLDEVFQTFCIGK